MQDDYAQRFGGIARLFGSAAAERLRAAQVCVIGVGGVGSWTVEALARSGVGAITLIDLDDVCVTNVNRQLPALDSELGRPKIDVLADRVRLINPACRVECCAEFCTETNASALLSRGFDFVVDGTDRLNHKCAIIFACRERGIPLVTVGSAGGRRDGTAVRICDLAHSVQDELLRQIRRKLRRDHDFPRDRKLDFGIRCVFSPEAPHFSWRDGVCRLKPEPGSRLKLDCATGFGAASFVTGAFGFAAAGEVVRRLALGA